MSTDLANSPLAITLAAAVPMWIEEIRHWSEAERMRVAGEAAQIIAEKGDRILYRSKKKGETANAFNALAKAIAICAFAPGGIKIFGMHFEARQQ